MKENQANNSESSDSEKKSYSHDIKKLRRKGIHQQKEDKQKDLYPSNEIEEDLENISFNSDGSCSSGVSEENQKVRNRQGGKKNKPIKEDQTSSKAIKNQTEIKQNNLIWMIVLAVIIFTLIFALSLWSCLQKQRGPYLQSTGDSVNIENLMTSIKNKYNTQSDLTYRIVKHAIKTAVSENSLGPGILILLASTEAKHVTTELALHIANAISKPYVDIKSNSERSPEELKKDFDDAIHRNLSDNKLKAVFVQDLDNLPFEAAMIFHSYCDHENAPFKNALYVMTVSSEDKILPSSDSKKFDELALKRLNSVWENSGADQVSSLISRLTVRVAGVTD